MKPILTIAYLLILLIQHATIEILSTIDHPVIRPTAMSIALLIFTLGWLYIALRILTARTPRRTYRDIQIQPARPNRYIHD